MLVQMAKALSVPEDMVKALNVRLDVNIVVTTPSSRRLLNDNAAVYNEVDVRTVIEPLYTDTNPLGPQYTVLGVVGILSSHWFGPALLGLHGDLNSTGYDREVGTSGVNMPR